jgi:prepilin-type processing-associated H-X9-DG protein
VIIVVILSLFVLILFPVPHDRGKARTISCISNMKQSSVALGMYEQDYDNLLPQRQWMDVLGPYTKAQVTYCIEVRTQNKKNFGHAIESTLLGRDVEKIAAQSLVPVLYDSRLLQANAAAPILKGIMQPGRHEGKNNVGFLDFHVKSLYNADLPLMRH